MADVMKVLLVEDDRKIASFIQKGLKEQGFAVDARDHNGWTPLHHAVLASRFHFCRGLLEQKADVNAQTEKEVKDVVISAEDGAEQLAGAHDNHVARRGNAIFTF